MSFHSIFPASYFWLGKVNNLPSLLKSCSDDKNLEESETTKEQKWKDSCLIETYTLVDASVLLECLNDSFRLFVRDMLQHNPIEKPSVILENYWINVYYENFYQEPHDHITLGDDRNVKRFSGVIFLNDGENYGQFKFVDTQPRYRKYNLIPKETKSPKSGDIIIFPCDTLHRVKPHKSSEKRMTIAFNFTLESE